MSAAANNFELKREIQSFYFNRELVAKSIFHLESNQHFERFRKISQKNIPSITTDIGIYSIYCLCMNNTMQWLQDSLLMRTGC